MSGARNLLKRVCRLVAFAALLALGAPPSIASGAPVEAVGAVAPPNAAVTSTLRGSPPLTHPAAVTPSSPVTVTLTSITPAVSLPRAPVTISGRVRNAGSVRIEAPVARALLGDRGLTSRANVAEWATPDGEQFLAEVARTPLGPALEPGAVAAFTLVLPATSISHRESFSVLPVSVEVVGSVAGASADLGSQHTFLPALSSIKAYEPLSIAWLVPLALDADPALHGIDSAARTAAWTKAIGAGSRLDRLITGTDSAKVTWAIDPAVLGPPEVPSPVDGSGGDGATPSPTTTSGASPEPTPSAPATDADPVGEVTTALATRLRTAAPRHTLWSLPYADPDLAALLPLPSGRTALESLLNRPSALAAAVGPTRTGIAWPVDGTLSTDREEKLRSAFSSSGLAAAVISASTRTVRSGYTDDASRKSTGGLPLLAYDPALSRAFAQTSTPASGATTIQLFLADSLAMLGERPGTRDRSVLVAAPRAFAGDPGVLGAFFAAVAAAPWLTPTSADELLAAAGTADPEGPAVSTTVPPRPTPSAPATSAPAPDPLSPGRSPLTQTRLQNISRTTSAIDGLASIRDDAQLFHVRWTDAQAQLLSSRWRGRARGLAAVNAATQSAITAVSRGVHVVPSSVNFFADRGVLQITVVNDLAVPVHDVNLTLEPGQPRLRIDEQPGPLRIGAKSRTNVRVHVTAIAAGLVPIEAVLTTPNGTSLGQNANVDVRVQPTSTWIYWVLGALVMLILVVGISRSLRLGTTRAAHPPAPKVPAHG